MRGKFSENKVRQCVFSFDSLFSLFPVKAIDRGVGFELVYSPAIKDSTMRRYTISNALNLMQVCKGKVWFHNFRIFFKPSSLLLLIYWGYQADPISLKQKVLKAQQQILPFQRSLQVLREKNILGKNNMRGEKLC